MLLGDVGGRCSFWPSPVSDSQQSYQGFIPTTIVVTHCGVFRIVELKPCNPVSQRFGVGKLRICKGTEVGLTGVPATSSTSNSHPAIWLPAWVNNRVGSPAATLSTASRPTNGPGSSLVSDLEALHLPEPPAGLWADGCYQITPRAKYSRTALSCTSNSSSVTCCTSVA